MAGWMDWLDKQVYIISKNSSHPYTGRIIDVDELSSKPLVWITIIDKFDKRVMFVTSEILSIKEEENL